MLSHQRLGLGVVKRTTTRFNFKYFIKNKKISEIKSKPLRNCAVILF